MTTLERYLPLFVDDCRAKLSELGAAVSQLEHDPGDRDALDEVFRLTHSIRGSAEAIGLAATAELARALEDALAGPRDAGERVPADTVDALGPAVDALAHAIDAIEATGGREPDGLLDRADRLRATRRDAQAAPDAPRRPRDGVASTRRGRRVRVEIAADCPLPAARALVVLDVAREHGEVVASDPAEDEIGSFRGGAFELRVAGPDPERLLGALAAVPDVAAAELVPEPPAPRRAQRLWLRVEIAALDRLDAAAAAALGAADELAAHVPPDLAATLRDRLAELTQAAAGARLVRADDTLHPLRRAVRDLAAELGKEVDLELAAGDLPVDRAISDSLRDPVLQLVRNALDHGVEPPDERERAGKPRRGRLVVGIRPDAVRNEVLVSVADDGRGVDPGAVAAAAVRRGLDPTAGIAELLLRPGFSTLAAPTSVSGRGVGLDLVRAAVERVGGRIELESEPGAGTTVTLRIPVPRQLEAEAR